MCYFNKRTKNIRYTLTEVNMKKNMILTPYPMNGACYLTVRAFVAYTNVIIECYNAIYDCNDTCADLHPFILLPTI